MRVSVTSPRGVRLSRCELRRTVHRPVRLFRGNGVAPTAEIRQSSKEAQSEEVDRGATRLAGELPSPVAFSFIRTGHLELGHEHGRSSCIGRTCFNSMNRPFLDPRISLIPRVPVGNPQGTLTRFASEARAGTRNSSL